ncbi:MAG: HD domain-containing protein [Erysipelotrichaceae bacterium]|nr:HD domain-containing protein [Erysipelotrichaceae bacterium]
MKQLWNIYHYEIPAFIQEFANTSTMQRLQEVGMNCGCEYTSFPLFKNIAPYSRYDHSIGVALIVWHFTQDPKQTIAGLLHDIATPVFAHTIDFLNDDHVKQESTEERTRTMIEESSEICDLLTKYQIELEDVVDYHKYPIADNDSPKLSADRLEYTLGNLWNYGFCEIEELNRYYQNLVVGINEDQEVELMFQNSNIGIAFNHRVMQTSNIYIADEDRFAMQALANLIKEAVQLQVICKEDLYLTEPYIINKLFSHPGLKQKWETFCQYSKIKKQNDRPNEGNWLCIPAKKRYIDVYIQNTGRASQLSQLLQSEIKQMQSLTFDAWLMAE